jgi:hypothetical protein
MKPFYLKGNYKGYPSFAIVVIRAKNVRADIISYDEATNLWDTPVKQFDLKDEKQIRTIIISASNFSEVIKRNITVPEDLYLIRHQKLHLKKLLNRQYQWRNCLKR